MSNTPSDAEIIELMRDGYNCRYNDEADHIEFARAVLAKWEAPQPAPAPLSDDAKDAARYRWLIDQHWIQTEVDWRLISTHQDSTIRQLDAAIDAALAAQGGKA